MAFPSPTNLANQPQAGSAARVYMLPYQGGTPVTPIADTDEVPLTGEQHGINSSGNIAEFNSNNGGRLVVKTRNDKDFQITTAAPASNAKVQELVDASNATGADAFMYFVILNPDGSYDYGVCVVGDRAEEGTDADGIATKVFSCSVVGEGEWSVA